MHWDDRWNDGAGWWWLFMLLMMIVFWGGLAWVIVTLVRRGPAPRAPHEPGRPAAEDILRERFARGEIDLDDYNQRLEVLRRTPHDR